MTAGSDDPEAPFLRFPKAMRRWTLRAVLHRLRQPLRRRSRDRRARQVAAEYKPAEVRGPTGAATCYALGDFSPGSGLGRAALYELDRLREESPGLEVRDLGAAIHSKTPPVPKDGPPIDRLYLLSPPDTYPWLLRAVAPQRIRHAWRVGLWVWETPVFPDRWRFAIPLVHEIWTPSVYSREAIGAVAGDRPVRVRPHNVVARPALAVDCGGIRRRFGIPETAFFGLAIMDIVSCPARKNPWAHVAAWRRAFGGDPGAVLLLKLRVSKRTRIVLRELEEMIGDAANIRIVEAELSGEDIAALQNAADVYLSLHRAEGYGLNIHECLASGTAVVATHYSANAEYGPDFEGYRPVPYRLVPYRDWTGHYDGQGFQWAEADLDATVAELRALSGRRVD